MNTNQNAEAFALSILNGLKIKMQNHVATDGIESADVNAAQRKIDSDVAALLIECGKQDFAEWVQTAPVKSIKRCVNFVHAIAHREISPDKSLGGDLISQALLLTARTLNSDSIPYELIKHQCIKAYESQSDIAAMSKGRNIMGAQRRQSPKTTKSQFSNRFGKNGFLKYLGLTTRSDDKSVVIDRSHALYKIASEMLKTKAA